MEYYNIHLKTQTFGSVKVQGIGSYRKFLGDYFPVGKYTGAIEQGPTATIKDGRKTVQMPRVEVLGLSIGEKLQELLSATPASTANSPLLEQLLAQVTAPAPKTKQQSQSDWDSANCLFLVKLGFLTQLKDTNGKPVYLHAPIWGWVMLEEVHYTKKAVAAFLDEKHKELLLELQEAASKGTYRVSSASKGSKAIVHYDGILTSSDDVTAGLTDPQAV